MDEHEELRGGSGIDRFMSRFVDFEAVGEPALDVGDAVEPAAAEPAAVPAPTAVPAPAGISRDDVASVFQEVLAEALREPEPAPQQVDPTSGLPPYDPFNPEVVRAYANAEAAAQAQQLVEQQLGPYRGLLDSFAEQQGRAAAMAELDRHASEMGSDFKREPAIRAAAFMASNGVPPAEAVRRAAAEQIQLEKEIRAEAETARVAQLQAMHGTPPNADTPGSGATPVAEVPTGPDRYRIQLDRSRAAHTGGAQVG